MGVRLGMRARFEMGWRSEMIVRLEMGWRSEMIVRLGMRPPLGTGVRLDVQAPAAGRSSAATWAGLGGILRTLCGDQGRHSPRAPEGDHASPAGVTRTTLSRLQRSMTREPFAGEGVDRRQRLVGGGRAGRPDRGPDRARNGRFGRKIMPQTGVITANKGQNLPQGRFARSAPKALTSVIGRLSHWFHCTNSCPILPCHVTNEL
jgi:hypothetical protein